jgi:frataxin-like iron-binding protein CyaY
MEPEKSDKIEKPKETVYEIEKMAELKEKRAAEGTTEITFDNAGNMVVNDRARRRNLKQLWRAVREGKRSIHYYTQPSGMDKPKTNKKTKKAERQNRRKGRK